MDAWPGLEVDIFGCAAHYIVRGQKVIASKLSPSTASTLLKRVHHRRLSPSSLYSLRITKEEDDDVLPIEPSGNSRVNFVGIPTPTPVQEPVPIAVPIPTVTASNQSEILKPKPLRPRTKTPKELLEAAAFVLDQATSGEISNSEPKLKPRVPRPKSVIKQPDDKLDFGAEAVSGNFPPPSLSEEFSNSVNNLVAATEFTTPTHGVHQYDDFYKNKYEMPDM